MPFMVLRGLTFKNQRLKDKHTFRRFSGVLRQSRSSTQLLCKHSVRCSGSPVIGLGTPTEGLGTAQCNKLEESSRHHSYQDFHIDPALFTSGAAP